MKHGRRERDEELLIEELEQLLQCFGEDGVIMRYAQQLPEERAVKVFLPFPGGGGGARRLRKSRENTDIGCGCRLRKMKDLGEKLRIQKLSGGQRSTPAISLDSE